MRVKGGTVTHRRRKAVLKQASSYFGSRHRLFRTANQAVMKANHYSYISRRLRKRDFRKLWITRINAACHANDISYSKFMHGLSLANIDLNRKMLSELAINDAKAFTELVEKSKKALSK